MILPTDNPTRLPMKNPSRLLAALAASVLLSGSALAQTDLEKAAAALKAGELASAEALVTPLTAPDSGDAGAFHFLSQLRVAQRRAKEAVEAAEQAVKLDDAKAEHHSQLGLALSLRMGEVNFMQMAMMSGRMKGAFEKSIALDPNHLSGLIGLARFHTNAPEIAGGSTAKAREYAERVRALHPVLGAAEFGRIAEREENFEEALRHHETVLAARPESAGAHFSVGTALARLGRKDEARARFEAALKLNPQFEAAQKALAEL
jgi:tetratricopeptide (TPR) repeat protein